MSQLIKRILKLPASKKIQIIISISLTLLFIISFPVLAWFTTQKKIATVAKVNSPAKLSIKSGAKEDIIQFRMSGINVGDGTEPGHKDYVFCVEGEEVSTYKLQIAHTTNINFTYTLYKAYTNEAGGEGVEYIDNEGNIHYYICKEKFSSNDTSSALYGHYINLKPGDFSENRKIADNNYADQYYEKSYENDDVIQQYAEPLYWQTGTIDANCEYKINSNDTDSISYNEYNRYNTTAQSDKNFLNFYVLRVSWPGDSSVKNDKETDIIYLTATIE